MIKRIWNGEIGLGWAFWGMGLLGTYPFFGLIIGTVLFGAIVAGSKMLPLPFRLMSLQMFGSSSLPLMIGAGFGLLFLCIPSVVIWRAANSSTSKLWRRLAKSYVVFAVSTLLLGPPLLLLMIFLSYMQEALTPEHLIDTPHLVSDAPAIFEKRIGIPFPEGTNVAHVIYIRHPVLDYEFDYHLIINAEAIDLDGWTETARPFGNKLVRQLPKMGLEWSTDGLDCDNRVNQSICNLVGDPKEILHLRHQVDLDNIVTLTIIEEDKLIWLHETQW
jgi:hypothetical protein